MDAPGPYGSPGHTDEEIGPEGKGEFPRLHSELVTEAGLRSGCPSGHRKLLREGTFVLGLRGWVRVDLRAGTGLFGEGLGHS